MAETRAVGLRLRRRADKSDPAALAADLPGAPPGTWPLAGVEHDGEPPERTAIAVHLVAKGITEGWIEAQDEYDACEVVHRPGGPPHDPWRVVHTFVQRDVLIICGVRYQVVRQPDKYVAGGTDNDRVTAELYAAGATQVDYFYGLERDRG